MKEKILTLKLLKKVLEKEKLLGKKIVQCHGVFDLFHPGHIIHFTEAKKLGDILIVSLTPDIYVNKGPNRPYFTEEIRLQFIASLEIVDYVVLNDSKDALSIIEKIRPDFYVKGKEYEDHEKDVTGKIKEEVLCTEKYKGKVVYTDGKTFSSSSILNQFFSKYSDQQKLFLSQIKTKYSAEQILKCIDSLGSLKVLIIADPFKQEDFFLKPRFSTEQSYISSQESKSLQGGYRLYEMLNQFATCVFPSSDSDYIPLKRRYFLEKEKTLLYEINHNLVSENAAQYFKDNIETAITDCDLVIAYDFHMGLFTNSLFEYLENVQVCKAFRCYTFKNDHIFANRSRFKRSSCKADLLLLQDKNLKDEDVKKYASFTVPGIENIKLEVNESFSATILCSETKIEIPSFEDKLRMGTFFPFISLCLKQGIPKDLCGFLGATYSAVCGEKIVSKEEFMKYIIHLLK